MARKVFYILQAHLYIQNNHCPDPTKCTNKKHWDRPGEGDPDGQYSSLSDARDAIKYGEDSPYVKIFKVTYEWTEEYVESVDNRGPADKKAGIWLP